MGIGERKEPRMGDKKEKNDITPEEEALFIRKIEADKKRKEITKEPEFLDLKNKADILRSEAENENRKIIAERARETKTQLDLRFQAAKEKWKLVQGAEKAVQSMLEEVISEEKKIEYDTFLHLQKIASQKSGIGEQIERIVRLESDYMEKHGVKSEDIKKKELEEKARRTIGPGKLKEHDEYLKSLKENFDNEFELWKERREGKEI